MKKPLAVVGAVTIALVLAGCSSPSSTANSPSVTQKAVTEAAPTPTPTPPASQNLGPHFVGLRPDGTKPFGAYVMYDLNATGDSEPVYDYSKNMMIEVDRVGSFKPDSTDGGRASNYTRYRLRVVNNTTTTIDLGGAFAVDAQDGDEAATRAYLDGWTGGPTGTLLPGRTIKWSFGFSDVHDDQVVTVQPFINGQGLGNAIFTK